MALSIATIWPDVLAGVVAVCGHVPEPAGWTPDIRPMKGLPVLMIHDPEFVDINEVVLESTRAKLQELGASLEEQWWAGGDAIVQIHRRDHPQLERNGCTREIERIPAVCGVAGWAEHPAPEW